MLRPSLKTLLVATVVLAALLVVNSNAHSHGHGHDDDHGHGHGSEKKVSNARDRRGVRMAHTHPELIKLGKTLNHEVHTDS